MKPRTATHMQNIRARLYYMSELSYLLGSTYYCFENSGSVSQRAFDF